MKDDTPSAGARWARLGRAGAGMAVRGAVARWRKVGATSETRQAIDQARDEANASRLFDALAGSRGVLMKVGQTLAQQSHSLSSAYVEKLATLQWDAPPMHGTLARRQFRLQLGLDPKDAFAEFEPRPFAAASLGQVHRARLQDGLPVAVKIQYPGIDRTVDSDLNMVRRMLRAASLGDRRSEWLAALEEVRERFGQEVDYELEAAHLKAFGGYLGERAERDVVVPRPIDEFSTRRVLTMERLEGQHIQDFLATDPPQAERDRLATRLLELYFLQLFVWGRLHADPHPGNLLFMTDGRLGWIDFGCVKSLEPVFMERMQRLFATPVDDVDALDGLYQELKLYRPEHADAAIHREQLLRLQGQDAGKYHRDAPFDFADGEYLRELSQVFRGMIRNGLTHPQFVFIVRTKFGLYNLFHQLGARVNVHRVLGRFL